MMKIVKKIKIIIEYLYKLIKNMDIDVKDVEEEKEKLLEKENTNNNIIIEDNENNNYIENNQIGVFYDNINVKKYDIKHLHSQIGFVQQEPSLFNETIYENIIYGLNEENTDNKNKNIVHKYEKERRYHAKATTPQSPFLKIKII